MIDYYLYNNNTTDRLTADYTINININTRFRVAGSLPIASIDFTYYVSACQLPTFGAIHFGASYRQSQIGSELGTIVGAIGGDVLFRPMCGAMGRCTCLGWHLRITQ